MKNNIKLIAGLVIGLFLAGNVVSAVSPTAVPFGGTGRTTITGIPYGTGTAPLSIVTVGSGLSFVGGTLSASGGGGTVTSVSGTTNRITSTGGATPVIDISATFEALLGKVANPLSQFASTTSAQLAGVISDETGSGALVFGTSPTISTGLTLGYITGSTQCLHVNTSGVVTGTGSDCGAGGSGLTVGSTSIASGTNTKVLFNNSGVLGEYTISGSGNVAMTTSPSFTTPTLGVASATTINKVTLTAPATGSTLTVADGKTLTASNSITLAGTDGKGIDIGAATSGKILIGNGSNLILSTPTYPTAAGTSGNVLTSDGTNWLSSAATSSGGFSVQDVPLAGGTTTTPSNNAQSMTSETDGSVMYLAEAGQAALTMTIYRLAKDTSSGDYYITHTTTLAITADNLTGIAVVGSNLYVNALISGTSQLRRYAKADLSGVTTMTISGTARRGVMWSDTTNLYISNGTTDQFDKFTISGTTATNAATVTFTTSGTAIGAIGNATNVWITDSTSGGTVNIRKYAVAGGSAVSTTSPIFNTNAYVNAPNAATVGLFIGSSSLLGVGWYFNWSNATAVTGIGIHLLGIALP